MVATGRRVDARAAAHFAPGHDQHIFVETPRVQVFDERRHAVIEQRHFLPHAFEIRRVPVPGSKRQCHATRPGFDQPTG